jgi:predicted AlkP superfamily phosphohydrolase/phosphomutase
MGKRIIILGIDGVPYGLMEELSDKGIMPNFKKIRKEGVFRKMQSSIPEISSVAWSSIITGKNPGEHGIFGFTDVVPGTYSLSFPNFNNLKEKPFWNLDPEKKSIIINVPSTYPAKELNGFLISGFVALDMEKAVYPETRINELEDIGYRIDVDSEKGHISKDMFLRDLFETLEIRMKLFRKMWDENKDWTYFMFVFTGTDRIGHFLWQAYKDKNHKYHKKFLDFFRKTDEAIGEINSCLMKDDYLIMVSDHGFESIKYNVYVNAVLAEKCFLKLQESGRVRLNSIEEGTKAFALDPGRIYINKEGKYPRGSVKKEEEEKVINEIIKTFENLEKDGEKIIKRIFRKEEIYHGKFIENAPDLVLLANPGFNLRGNISKKEIFEEDVFEGKHTQDDAFLLVKNLNDELIPKDISVEGVLDIINKIEGGLK